MAKLNDNERIREILKKYRISDEPRITKIIQGMKENGELYKDLALSDDSYKDFSLQNNIGISTLQRFVRLFSKDGNSENRAKFYKIISEIYDLELSPKKEIKIKDEKINKANERTKEQKKLGWRNSKLSLVIIVVLSILFLIYAYCVPKQEFPF